ncbi:MAG: amidohydrolase family protein [Geminicoccaceae bacterium]
MPTLGGTSTSFTLAGKTIHLRDGRLVDADGTLAGAHLSMIDAVRNMIRLTDVSSADALRMTSTAPARALGLGDELGRITPGFRASLTLLDEVLAVEAVVVDGQLVD